MGAGDHDFDRWLLAEIAAAPRRCFTAAGVAHSLGEPTCDAAARALERAAERGMLQRRVFVHCENGHREAWVADSVENVPFDDIACDECHDDDPGEWQFRFDYIPTADAQQRAGATGAAHGPLTPTRFVVGGPDAIDDRWAHVVEHRGRGRWAALVHGFDLLGVDGTTLPAEPLPSSRDDAYLAVSRFDRPSAAAAALRAYECEPRCCYCASRRAVTA